MSGYSTVNLKDVDNYGANFELPEEDFQLRMARVPLGCEIAGISYKRLGPGWREPFGHTHKQQEEIYVLVSGSARMKIEDEILELTPWTATRLAPGTMRGLEGGSDGAELIVVGAPQTAPEDAEVVMGWWSD